MIIVPKDTILPQDIKFKKKLNYSNGFTRCPLLYKNENLILQSPLLYSMYGIDKYNFIDVSFQNKINDPQIIHFQKNIHQIVNKVKSHLDISIVDVIKNKSLRLKLHTYTVFNFNKEKIDTVPPNTYGYYLIHIPGVWIYNKEVYLQTIMLQAKIDIPLFLSEYSFLDETLVPPRKPPPPAPPLPSFSKNKKTIQEIIQQSVPKRPQPVSVDYTPPTVDDIQMMLKKMKRLTCRN